MKLSVMLTLLLLSAQALAAPAAWYQWRSKLNGDLVCRQTTPGSGWEKFSGPFKDAQCEHLRR
ncbi:hypothetical protein [Sulfuriferula thiophila]|uniref:hypothetical protein n=1 Tax=Sulfuriferula thiophila TaxID=1781211 RepID=UPI000F6110DD|nr:hypothetical protein [Sulfuriferula thiophila]